ncbi:TetR/AcrR family transcriptional regulator [Sphingosinicella sp. CPCC 101087]|uniref:TetR/AcrR family transcriptional regulator n=1 Tax=Sphingosinicella sp. CPCC 101087 TaxID=2497754 RepID=UPI00197F94A1|nr:TetR/AcrR family transcriptional regulator [Sphingosinicella sp. CPCC 101087]
MEGVRDVFWKHGYAGTTVDQLAAATGLHKPSLYGAFGDKRSLYLEALDRYIAEARILFGAALLKPKLADSLDALALRAIELFSRGGRGCFMMTTAVPEAGGDEEITAKVRSAMEELDSALASRFRQAIATGELSQAADASALAMIVAANHYDLSARARAGYSADELRTLADRTLDVVWQLGGRQAS